MAKPVPEAVARVIDDAAVKGLRIEAVETAGSRTAEEAAKAVGTIVGRIVKCLVFEGVETGRAYLLLVSGSNRVDETRSATWFGETLKRPDAGFVRHCSGFAIGGVPPFGFLQPMPSLMDEDLFRYPTIWAAAGTPRHVFEVVPLQLRSALAAGISRFD